MKKLYTYKCTRIGNVQSIMVKFLVVNWKAATVGFQFVMFQFVMLRGFQLNRFLLYRNADCMWYSPMLYSHVYVNASILRSANEAYKIFLCFT